MIFRVLVIISTVLAILNFIIMVISGSFILILNIIVLVLFAGAFVKIETLFAEHEHRMDTLDLRIKAEIKRTNQLIEANEEHLEQFH